MKWTKRRSPIKDWVKKHRQGSWHEDYQIILPLFPKKLERSDEVYWLQPVGRVRYAKTYDTTGIFGGPSLGFTVYWTYTYPREKNPWRDWLRLRTLHHLAGLVNFAVVHLWVVALCLFITFPIWGIIFFGINPLMKVLNFLFGGPT